MYISRSLWINVPLQTDKIFAELEIYEQINKLKSNKRDTTSILLKIPFPT